MSWNGSGTFNRQFSWVADKNAGLNISSSRMDTDTNDIASNGFGNCLTRDGQGQATANLPMATFRHTGVGAAAARTDYARFDQVQDGVTLNWTTAGGSADALTATYTPSLTALVDGQLCFVRAGAANATTTPTFAPNGLTAHTITKAGGAALVAGDITGNLAELVLRYNLSSTRWELLNPAAPAIPNLYISTAMLAAAAVTYAKIQNVTNARLLGNNSGGAAAPQEISVGTGLLLSGTALSNPRTTPTYQVLTSGTTYTTPANVTYIKVRAVGGGGGGGGSGGASGAGGDTNFNSIVAKGGTGGSNLSGTDGGNPGVGGSAGTGTANLRLSGAPGGGGGDMSAATGAAGGMGGATPFGGAGAPGSGGNTGQAAIANSGSGGGGFASSSLNNGGGGGGGAGEYFELIIGSPAASYTYAIGAAGSAATNGGLGGAGRIVVEEFYN